MPNFGKSPAPIKIELALPPPPAILGPEMGVPILWAPGIFCFFLLENPHAHKIPPFKGGCWGFLEGGKREVFLLTVGACLLTVELLCLQSLKALY